MYGIEAEDFLILNPLLYSDLDKYIWISDSYEEHRSAQQMFDYLMKRNIYVKGFAEEKSQEISEIIYKLEKKAVRRAVEIFL